ncbi:MAG: methylmalonyl Co-A mutase-associated GTPase MeaB, partial [Spirosomaceae bacterium]|nr:methylmalonyl Co-A mutase-associated GTPase MeaB [Spirosomataceae bacterium]
MPSKRLSLKNYVDGIRNGDRLILSRAITLVESQLPSDRTLAEQLLSEISGVQKDAIRIAITGVPGVGKSTFIEAFGSFLTTQNKKVAVLSVDPTSQRSKGSIMGDKTRMDTLSYNPLAYVRPSPTGGSLGGVTNSTSEAILLCESAGYEVIIVETVGVGQSETIVKEMVDFFLLLMLPGAGDELQGIKRGIMEMADLVAINKADENQLKAKQAQIEYRNALHLFPATASGWIPKVTTCSAIQQTGLSEIWEQIKAYEIALKSNGFWQRQRENQRIAWMHRYNLEHIIFTVCG